MHARQQAERSAAVGMVRVAKIVEMADIIVRGNIVLDIEYGKIFRDGT